MSDRFGEILDRQMATDREGESERQACSKREGSTRKSKDKGRKGYGHKRSARKRTMQREAR